MGTKDNRNKSRVTIKDVAKAANVSIATVSYVLNNTPGQSISDETRKKVFQFANLLGYECNVMARYLATGKTNTVAVVVKPLSSLAAPYYMKLITELSRLFLRIDFDMKLMDYTDGLNRNNSTCDAYITVALTESEFRAFADTKYVPVIAVDSVFDDFLFFRINDDYKTMYETAKHESTEKKINFLTCDLPEECKQLASKYFDDVTVVHSLKELMSLDANIRYVTVSSPLYETASSYADIKIENASYALKASAVADAVTKAISRRQASFDEHDIKV